MRKKRRLERWRTAALLPCAATSLVAMSGGVADGFRSLVSSWAGSRGQAAPAAVGNAVERATAAVKDTVFAYSASVR